MLPPLRSSLGSGSSFQNHSLLSGSAQTGQDGVYKVQFSDSREDSNPSSAGRLNVLLLAGRERIADHLSMLADALGEAVHLPRRDGEGTDAYVMRLAETLSRMTPRQRADVERQLNLIIQGLKLRFLFEAFGNPTGPEAARIVAYLETARFKDRDPLTRSVVTSYRQHGGPEASLPGDVAGTPAAEATAGKTGTAAAQAPSPAGRMPAGTVIPAGPLADAAAATKSTDGAMPSHATPAQAAEAMPFAGEAETGIDARSLQSLLRMAFEGGESGDSSIEAKATAQLLAAERGPGAEIAGAIEAMVEEPAEFILDARFEPVTLELRAIVAEREAAPAPAIEDETIVLTAFANEDAESVSPPSRAGALALPMDRADYQPTLLTLKGWTEADFDARDLSTVYEAIVEDGEEAQKLIAADAANPAISEDDIAQADADTVAAEMQPEEADSLYDPRSATPDAVLSDETIPARPAPAETAVQDTPAKPAPVAAEKQALAQLLPTGREAPLIAFVPYAPSPDDPTEPEAREARPDQDERPSDENASGQDREREEQAAAAHDPLPDPDEDGEDDGERAYGLYQRMAGWA